MALTHENTAELTYRQWVGAGIAARIAESISSYCNLAQLDRYADTIARQALAITDRYIDLERETAPAEPDDRPDWVKEGNPRKTDEELAAMLQACPEGYSRWRHIVAGETVLVLGRAILEETCTPGVIYECSNGVRFVRELDVFLTRFTPLSEATPPLGVPAAQSVREDDGEPE